MPAIPEIWEDSRDPRESRGSGWILGIRVDSGDPKDSGIRGDSRDLWGSRIRGFLLIRDFSGCTILALSCDQRCL